MATKRLCVRDNVTPECQVFTEDNCSSKLMYEKCTKKEGHKKFIPANEFTMKDLPLECQTKEFMEGFRLRCDLTVKVIVNYTSTNRPDTYIKSEKPYPYCQMKGSDRAWRTGTGYIRPDSIHFPTKGKPCQCCLCQESGDPKMVYLEVAVFTATHLVFDHFEAENSIFECFYDSEDRKDVKLLYGKSVTDPDELKRCVNDSCLVNCVTHDLELINRLMKVSEKKGHISLYSPSITKGVIISHPHGFSKQVSLGNILYCGVHKDPRLPIDVRYEFGKDARCRVPRDYTHHAQTKNPGSSTSENTTSLQKSMNFDTTEPCTKQNNMLNFDFDIKIKPGREYTLPPGMTFTLPLDSSSFCTFQLPIKFNTKLWVKFPEGTKFTLPDGRTICLQPETEFCWSKGKATANNKSCVYIAYDMATCPGSSGAVIFRCDHYWSMFPHFPHCGAQEDGHNRSSNISLFCYYETWMAFPSINS